MPQAHWTFDQGSGPVAADSSGNGHDATLGAGVSWDAGNVGAHSISMAGTSNGVATATGPVVDTAGSFTASAWVNFSALGGYQTVVSIAGNTVAGFYLQLRGDTGTLSFARLPSDANGVATVVAAPTAPAVGTWYHFVGVNDAAAGTLTLYVDGQSVGTAPYTSGWTASGDTLIGHGLYNGSQVDFVKGSIDEVELFDSALSPEQVAALDQPAAYPFDEGTGNTAADFSGHGNTLSLDSGASWADGKIGAGSLAVNGTANGNATHASAVLDTSQPFSVSAWVNLNSTSGFQTFASIDGTNTSAFYLQLREDTGKFAFTRLGSDSTLATAYHADAINSPSTGVWYNLIGVNDVADGQLQLYVNGVLQSTVAYSGGWQATGATVIGASKFNGSRVDFVNGQIDDVHFYNSPLSSGVAAFIGTNGNSILNIDASSTGVTVSPKLFGAFMEDINYGGEGGIYNNEIRNSGFNDSSSALRSWARVRGTGVNASLASDTTTGPTSALTQSAKLTITSGVSATARVGISNSGYFGIAVAPSTSYQVEFYAKATAGFTGPLTVDLESTTGTVYASATVPSITTSWTKYTLTLNTGAGVPTSSSNLFVISTNSSSANNRSIWFGAAYLYPPAYNGAPNHLRTDLMQKLADLGPAIFRVPGGNYLEGNTFADRFNWSTTIGPVDNRPGHFNSAWGYWSTDGMGLDEYLQMAEEVGAEPILAVYAGYTLNGSSDTGATLNNDVTDAVNELHYVLDPTTTSWGAMRAANGHPAAYNVNYVEIGNEDWFSSTYPTRYPLFYNAIHAAFPSLKIIATSSSTGGSPFDVLDDHFYNSPQWFMANSHHYDNTPRGSYKIFVGEYAAREGSPTNDMAGALGDASWLLGLERNSDLVIMSSYAPLWANVNGLQWTPDLIGFDNTSSYGSPSYYAQLMLNQNHGNTVVSDTLSGAGGLQVLVTRTDSTYYLTVVNTLATANTTTVSLSGAEPVSATGTVTSLSAASATATNSITDPTAIVPVTSTVTGLGANFDYTFPGYSITILQFSVGATSPTVATPASAAPSPVNGTTTDLSVLGADDNGEANLTYTWGTTGPTPAPVSFSANGTNAAKNTTATFSEAGIYHFIVTIADADAFTTASSVTVTVNQTATSVVITPDPVTVAAQQTAQFSAVVQDQFSQPIVSGSVIWSVNGGGTVDGSGLFTASQAGGSYIITASSGSISGTATVNVVPTIYSGSSSSADSYYIRLADDGVTEQIWVGSSSPGGSPTYSIDRALLPGLTFNGIGGGDQLSVDFTNGDPVPGSGVSFEAGISSDGRLLVVDNSGNADNITLNSNSVAFNSAAPISYAHTQSLTISTAGGNDVLTQSAQPSASRVTFNGGGGSDTLNVNAGTFTFNTDASIGTANLAVNVAGAISTVRFNATQHLAALNLSSSANAVISAAASDLSPWLLITGGLSFDTSNARLDLTNNELFADEALATLQDQIVLGRVWTSIAGRAIGSMDLGNGQVEARPTLRGDTNLDGSVDVSDLGNLATNWQTTSGATWSKGDFNYDGAVDVTDLGELASNWQQSLGSGTAAVSSAVVAPEISKAAVAPAPTSVSKTVFRAGTPIQSQASSASIHAKKTRRAIATLQTDDQL